MLFFWFHSIFFYLVCMVKSKRWEIHIVDAWYVDVGGKI